MFNENKTREYVNLALKPKAIEVSSWDGRKTILYGCPKCNADFRILGEQVKYCFNCGQKINWDVLTQLSEGIDSLYYKNYWDGNISGISQEEFEKEFIKTINERQLQ